MNTTNEDPRSLERALAHEAIAASGAQPADNVTIAGTEHLDVLIELLRRGFSHVLCRSADRGPHMATPPADVIIAPNVKNEADLRSVATQLGSDLRPRGVLLISCTRTGPYLDERRVRQLLTESGFTAVVRIAARGGRGILWCAHKHAASISRAA